MIQGERGLSRRGVRRQAHPGGGGQRCGEVQHRAGGKQDVTTTHTLWTSQDSSYVPSPVEHNGHLYWVSDTGLAYCMKAATGKVIYKENGVTIRSIPAIHAIDGAVSFILEWNGFKFVYGGDTAPNKWYIEYSKGADVAIHESFLDPRLLITKQGFAPEEAVNVGTVAHTSPAQFGKVMSMTEPRLAVGYHFFNDYDTQPEVNRRVRKTYDGPLALALDYMVFNVTKDDIQIRMSAVDEEIWPSPALKKKNPPDTSKAIPFTDFTKSGVVPLPEVVQPIYDEVNKEYGTDAKPVFK